MNELGEIPENIASIPVPKSAPQENNTQTAVNTGNANVQTQGRGNGRGRGRGRRAFVRQTGESDPYDMSIAPLNIYENTNRKVSGQIC